MDNFTKDQARVIDIVLDFLADPRNEFSDLMTEEFNQFFEAKFGRELIHGELENVFEKLRENESEELF